MATSSSLSEYLKKYTSEGKPKSIKKKKSKPSVNVGGVRIVDEDPAWQAEIKDDSTHEDSPGYLLAHVNLTHPCFSV